MADKAVTIELPLDMIRASPGFCLDIGDLTTKLVYRAKDDFEQGEPRNTNTEPTEKGSVRMISFPSDNMEPIITYIQEHCDLTTEGGDGSHLVFFTSVSEQKSKIIKDKLHLEMKFLNKFRCYAAALCYLIKTVSVDDVFTPVCEEGTEEGQGLVTLYKGFQTMIASGSKGVLYMREELEEYRRETAPRFPAILTVCEAEFDYVRVEEDGSFKLLDSCSFGGMPYLALSKYLTGITDKEELAHLVEKSTGETVDTYAEELVNPGVEDDPYSELHIKVRLFPFGKMMADSRERATSGDLVHSLLQSVCETGAQVGYQVCQVQNIPTIYFCGQLVNTNKAQQFTTSMMHLRQHITQRQVNYEFIRHGEYLAALGGFMETYTHVKN